MSAPASRQLALEYSNKAAEYARHWAPVIVPMALPLLDRLPLRHARRIVDIGSGTGAMLPHVRRRAPHAFLVATDLSEGMLRLAGEQAPAALLVSDAQSLSIASGSVDVAVLVFVLFHMPAPAAALREAARVLRRDGTLGIVTWGADPGVPGLEIWKDELERAGAPPDPRDSAVMQQPLMDTPAKLRALVERQLTIAELWSAAMRHEWEVDELIAMQVGCGLAARRLPGLSAERRSACEERVRARMRRLSREEMTYTPQVLFAVAKQPPGAPGGL